jgi:hypothetical protein
MIDETTPSAFAARAEQRRGRADLSDHPPLQWEEYSMFQKFS